MNRPTAADNIISALNEHNADYAKYVIAEIKPRELRAVCLELARRIPTPMQLPDGDEGHRAALESAIVMAATAFRTTPNEVLSKSHRQAPCEARQVACYVAHLLGDSHSRVGRQIGRHHSSVMAAVSRVGETPRLRAIAQRIAQQHGWDREAEAS